MRSIGRSGEVGQYEEASASQNRIAKPDMGRPEALLVHGQRLIDRFGCVVLRQLPILEIAAGQEIQVHSYLSVTNGHAIRRIPTAV